MCLDYALPAFQFRIVREGIYRVGGVVRIESEAKDLEALKYFMSSSIVLWENSFIIRCIWLGADLLRNISNNMIQRTVLYR